MRVAVVTFLGIAFFTGTVFCQELKYPFPQNIKYPYGFMPATFSTENFQKWYSKYKSGNLLQSCNGGIATRTDNGTKVEAMGWAMIVAAYMGDKETFDGLHKFYESKIQRHGMMAWLTSCGGVSDAGSASDGDLDVAFSLLVATWQWGDNYKKAATDAINTVEKLIANCEGTSVLYGGYGSDGRAPYGGCNQTDISYYTPAFFRAFAEFTGNNAWTKLADDTYTVLNNAANKNTGLVPNWHTWKGGQSSMGQYTYGFDACRVPWRIALDYLWNGNEKAKQWCTTISNWANKVGPKNIKDGYTLDGSPTGNYHNMSFVGGFAVAAMCNSQEISDAFGKEVASMSYDSYWYHAYLGNCYMLAMSGNMWRPGLDTVSAKRIDGNRAREKSITLRKLANRKLVLSGIGKGLRVNLISLSGKQVKYAASITENEAFLDISTLKSGCYLLTVTNETGASHETRLITVY